MPTTFIPWSLLVFFLLTLQVGADAARREVITARNGVVAADHGTCSIIGKNVLREGGHAVDAAVATAFCLGVVNPSASGIGGGGFMLVRLANGTAQGFDMRETAPAASTLDMYTADPSLKVRGLLSVAVPSEVAGLYEAWKQFGKLPWERLVRPAEELAREGFKVHRYLHHGMVDHKAALKSDKGLRDVFTSNGEILKLGDLCQNKKLAETLRAIARGGMRAFYNGSVGLNLIKDVTESGGIMTMEDLTSYKVKLRTPVGIEFLGLKLLTMPPPSSGGVTMSLVLNILQQYGFPKDDVHQEIEALKHAFSVRMNLGDPDFSNITGVVSYMLSPTFARGLKKTIYNNMTFDPSYYGRNWNVPEDYGTSHVSIVDKNRNAVAMTTTINHYFGAYYLSPSTGIILNNQMDDFWMPIADLPSGVPPLTDANFIAPFKRPLSSTAPTIILQGENLKAVVGASGGPRIIGAVTAVLLNHFVKGMDPLSAVVTPRYYHQLNPNHVEYENWTSLIGDYYEVSQNIRTGLEKKGHKLQGIGSNAVSQFVVQNFGSDGTENSFGELVAVSDPRKLGFPAGF